MRYYVRCSVIALLALGIMGCDMMGLFGSKSISIDTTDPFRAEVDGIEILLQAPDEVRQHEPFKLKYMLINHRSSAVTITTRSGCLALMSIVDEGDESANMDGAAHGCTAALTDHHLAAGDTTSMVLNVRAEQARSDEPVEPGMYKARGKGQVYEVDGTRTDYPDVHRQMVVTE